MIWSNHPQTPHKTLRSFWPTGMDSWVEAKKPKAATKVLLAKKRGAGGEEELFPFGRRVFLCLVIMCFFEVFFGWFFLLCLSQNKKRAIQIFASLQTILGFGSRSLTFRSPGGRRRPRSFEQVRPWDRGVVEYIYFFFYKTQLGLANFWEKHILMEFFHKGYSYGLRLQSVGDFLNMVFIDFLGCSMGFPKVGTLDGAIPWALLGLTEIGPGRY